VYHPEFTKVHLVGDHPRHQCAPSGIDHRGIVRGTDRSPDAFDSTVQNEQIAYLDLPLDDQAGIGKQQRSARQS
jgi:hypothetical protein